MAEEPKITPRTFVTAGDAHIADAIRAAADKAAGEKDPDLRRFRRKLFGELEKLIPEAVQQAKLGKPALLRILTRFTR
jgi:hypothetical protein